MSATPSPADGLGPRDWAPDHARANLLRVSLEYAAILRNPDGHSLAARLRALGTFLAAADIYRLLVVERAP